jgi:(p)ppGpp synthase/HD superfamily hydrolase
MIAKVYNNLDMQQQLFFHAIKSFSSEGQKRIQQAVIHATRSHDGQYRDDGVPYIIHPIRVALLLIEHGEQDVDLIIAALLHDVVEDCADTIEDIRTLYGESVAALVKDATRERPEVETEEMKREAKPKKFRWYIAEANVDSCKIKSADVIDNMRSWQYIPSGHSTRDKFPRWCSEAETFYPALTQKAGIVYYETFCELAVAYQAMPQFHEYLKEVYTI